MLAQLFGTAPLLAVLLTAGHGVSPAGYGARADAGWQTPPPTRLAEVASWWLGLTGVAAKGDRKAPPVKILSGNTNMYGPNPAAQMSYYNVDGPYWDTYVSVADENLGYSVSPTYVSNIDPVLCTAVGPSNGSAALTALWDYVWYWYDDQWNPVDVEYQEVPTYANVPTRLVAPKRSHKRSTSRLLGSSLVNGADSGGHLRPDLGALPSKHRQQTYRCKPAPPGLGCFDNFVGLDLDKSNGTLYYFPAPDVVDFRHVKGSTPTLLEFRRVYRQPVTAGAKSSLGLPDGWFHNWDVYVEYAGAAKKATFRYPGGESEEATMPDAPVSLPYPFGDSIVGWKGSGDLSSGYTTIRQEWTAGAGAGTIWEFDHDSAQPTHYTLKRVTLPSHVTMTLDWDPATGHLRSISDLNNSTGPSLTLSYDSKGWLTEVDSSPIQKTSGKYQNKTTYQISKTLDDVRSVTGKPKARHHWSYAYTADGRLQNITDERGRHRADAGRSEFAITWPAPPGHATKVDATFRDRVDDVTARLVRTYIDTPAGITERYDIP